MSVPRGANQIPETVIVTTLRASCGGHHPIMSATTDRTTGRKAINGPDRLKKWRELSHISTECRENQLRGWLGAERTRIAPEHFVEEFKKYSPGSMASKLGDRFDRV